MPVAVRQVVHPTHCSAGKTERRGGRQGGRELVALTPPHAPVSGFDYCETSLFYVSHNRPSCATAPGTASLCAPLTLVAVTAVYVPCLCLSKLFNSTVVVCL